MACRSSNAGYKDIKKKREKNKKKWKNLFLLTSLYLYARRQFMKKKVFSTQVKNDLLKEFKKLAIDLERPINDILEEAMQELLGKYGKNRRLQ
jgi:hypothetical protein